MQGEKQYLFATPIGLFKLKEDLDSIIKFAYSQQSRRNVSNRGGIQTQDLDCNQKPIINLCKTIIKTSTSYAKEFNITENLFLENIWININKTKDFNVEHAHPFSLISGTFYVKTNKNSGNIVFNNPNMFIESYVKEKYIQKYNEVNSNVWKYQPIDNLLLLFPSWIKHYVEPNQSQEDRISISFNVNVIS